MSTFGITSTPLIQDKNKFLSISTPDVSTSSSSTQAQLLPSTSSISASNSESQPPISTCNDTPSNNTVTPIESSSSIISTSSSHSPLFNHPLILIQYRMPRKETSESTVKEKKKKNY
ncbi:hypothetical protein TNCV_1082291 [Trichonephila clavipes]|nr:hypothetical protein TNCV_1082291 [Trichonephila clavipes]